MSNEIINQQGGALSNRPENLPAFIQQGGELAGTELLSQFIQPPRLKIVQPQSKPELKAQFNEGDIVIMPQKELVVPIMLNEHNRPTDKGNAFLIVPIYFYPEYCSWNPIGVQGTMPAIRERSTDQNSVIAKKARNPQTREEICPEFPRDADGKPQFIRHTEHLNFLCSLISVEALWDTPVLISFFRGEAKTGQSFCAAIRMRHTHIYACQFQAQAARRTNAKGNWFGLDISNPPMQTGVDNRWVHDEALFNYFAQLHQEYAKAHKAGTIISDYDDEDSRTVDGSAVDATAAQNADGSARF